MTWLGILMLGAGVGLVYAAVTNQHPIAELQIALGGKPAQQPAAATGSAGTQPIPNAPSNNGTVWA